MKSLNENILSAWKLFLESDVSEPRKQFEKLVNEITDYVKKKYSTEPEIFIGDDEVNKFLNDNSKYVFDLFERGESGDPAGRYLYLKTVGDLNMQLTTKLTSGEKDKFIKKVLNDVKKNRKFHTALMMKLGYETGLIVDYDKFLMRKIRECFTFKLENKVDVRNHAVRICAYIGNLNLNIVRDAFEGNFDDSSYSSFDVSDTTKFLQSQGFQLTDLERRTGTFINQLKNLVYDPKNENVEEVFMYADAYCLIGDVEKIIGVGSNRGIKVRRGGKIVFGTIENPYENDSFVESNIGVNLVKDIVIPKNDKTVEIIRGKILDKVSFDRLPESQKCIEVL